MWQWWTSRSISIGFTDTINPEDAVLTDVNGDGKLDAIVSNYSYNINVFLGNGNGTFQSSIGIKPGAYPRRVNAAGTWD